MKNKYSKIILLMLICNTGILCNAQNGYIVTNSNNIIKGEIIWRYKTLLVPTYVALRNEQNKKERIEASDIKYVRIKEKKKIDSTTYMPVEAIGKSILKKIIPIYFIWKVLAAKDSLSICVMNYSGSDEGVMTGNPEDDEYESIAIFFGKAQAATIYNGLQLTNKDKSYIGQQVLQFIYSRYNLILMPKELSNYFVDKNDFEHQKKLFDFILGLETDFENNAKKNTVK
jgi:hypothetical protein